MIQTIIENCLAKNDFRVTCIFKIIISICMKNVVFCRKTSKFLPKRCLFIFCIFYLNEKELNQQVCLITYVENEISNSTSHKKEREREAKTSNLKNISKTPEKLSLVTLVTNYHKLSILLLLLEMSYIFIASTKVLNVLQISAKLNFCH